MTIRPLASTDASAIAALLPDLGDEATAAQVVQRLADRRECHAFELRRDRP